jgi:AGZA family xanthine/uracil permease-like MFS transporter
MDSLKLPAKFVEGFGLFVLLAHGFILTGMLWGAALAFLIDKRIVASAAVLGICSALSLFGFIHSVLPTGGIYLPGSASLSGSSVPYHWAAGYLSWAILLLVLGRKPQAA